MRRERESQAMPATRALTEGEKKRDGDDYLSKNEKVSDLWRPGAGFKPTTFLDPKGPKVLPSLGDTAACILMSVGVALRSLLSYAATF